MGKICCPEDHIYIQNAVGVGVCVTTPVRNSTTVLPIECPCCPNGTVYINNGGYYIDPLGLVARVANLPATLPLDSCFTVQSGYIIPYTQTSPVTCPCCPPGMTYDSMSKDPLHPCKDSIGNNYATVPCIPCVCDDPPPPPPCTTCTDAQGTHVAFALNPNIKQCTDCGVVGEPKPLDCNGTFMPIQLQDPIINFTLRS